MGLRLDLEVPPGPLRRSEGAEVTVTLVNEGPNRLLINRRMSPGYSDSFPREIYFVVNADYGKQKYDRSISDSSDYDWLASGDAISTRIDLLAWYRIKEPGTFQLIANYQCDEPGSRFPQGIVRGLTTSKPIEITVD